MSETKEAQKKQSPQEGEALNDLPLGEVMGMQGISSLIQLGLVAGDELRSKNRLLLAILMLFVISLIFNIVQYNYRPEPRLLGETSDGRIRPLPLLSDPMYSTDEILGWAERCVTKIYGLSYVDWKQTVQNETGCLSDQGRKGFVGALKKIGLLDYLNSERQGIIYAVPNGSVIRTAALTAKGYQQWIVEVPYRLNVDGRQKGAMELVMVMQIRRVSLLIREDGLWVESYEVKPRGPGR